MATDPTQPQQTSQSPFDLGESSGPWALEETLKKVLNVLQKDLTNSNKEVKSIDALNRNIDRLIQTVSKGDSNEADANRRMISLDEQQRKSLRDAERIARQNARSQEEIARNTKQSKDAARQALLGGGSGGGGRAMGGVLGAAKAVVQKTWNGISQAGQAIMQSGGDITAAAQGVAAAIPALGGVLGASVGMVNNAQEIMAGMAKVGQSFNSSLVGMSQSAANAGLSMTQMAAIVTENSQTVAKMGAQDFLKLQLQVRRSTERFGRFGLSVEDQSKVIAGYVETQMSLGRRQNINNQKAITEYTAKLSTLSKLTGKSIDQLMEEQQAAADSPDVYAAAERVFERSGKAAAENFQNVVMQSANVLPDAMKGLSQDMLSDYGKYGSIAASDLGAALTSAGKGDVVKQLDQAIASGNAEAYTAVLGQISKDAQDFGSPIRRVLTSLSLGSDAVAQSAKQVIAGTIATSKTNEAALNNLNGEVGKTMANAQGSDLASLQKSQTDLQIQLGQAQTQLLQASVDLYPGLAGLATVAAKATTALLKSEAVGTALDTFSAALAKAPGELERMFDSMRGLERVDSAIASVIGTIADLGAQFGKLTGLGEGLGSILGLVIAFAGGKAALKGAGSLISKGAGAVAGKFAGRGGAGAVAAEGAVARGATGAGLRGLAGGAAKGLARGGIVGAGIESMDYIFGDKQFTGKNLAKSALTVGGGALGGLLGSALGPVGTILGGAGGAAGGKALGDWLLGPDDVAKPADIKKAADAQNTAQSQNNKAASSNEASRHKTQVANQSEKHKTSMTTARAEMAQIQNFYNYRIKLEKILSDQQVKLATIRNNYEISLLNKKYQVQQNAAKVENRNKSSAPVAADVAFKSQVEQAMATRKQIDQYQAKAAKMNALGQTGIIVQPSIGNDIGSKQLQEMKLTNQFLYNIYDNQRGSRKFKPLVAIYQPGL